MRSDDHVFAVGHYGGRFLDAAGDLRYHAVRVGPAGHRLGDDEAFTVWLLGHGDPDDATADRWTVGDLRQRAAASGVPTPERTIEEQVRAGVLVPVAAADLESFARTYRLAPLMTGLGNAPDDLVEYGIGLAGFGALATVDRVAGELWQFGVECDTLWHACELSAQVSRETGDTDPALTDPARVLAGTVPALRTLLVQSAAYLDLAR